MADHELETFARALGRTRGELEQEISESPTPKAALRRIEARVERKQRQVEQADEDAWLKGQSESSRERFEQLRSLTDAELAQHRDTMTLGGQVDQALADAALLTAVSAGEPGSRGHGKLEGRSPGHIAGAMYTPGSLDVPTKYRRVIGVLVANLWREVDRARRSSLAGDQKFETSSEKETRLNRDWKGIRSEIVSALEPAFGSPRSVEQMRRRTGHRPIDGEPVDPKPSEAA